MREMPRYRVAPISLQFADTSDNHRGEWFNTRHALVNATGHADYEYREHGIVCAVWDLRTGQRVYQTEPTLLANGH